MIPKEAKFIVFDGVCNLCNRSVDWVIIRDVQRRFRYVPLQSEAGKFLRRQFALPEIQETILLIQNGQILAGSDAVLQIAGELRFPWKMLKLLRIIPHRFREKIYRWIARNRYHWFGQRESCRLPTPEEAALFPTKEALELYFAGFKFPEII